MRLRHYPLVLLALGLVGCAFLSPQPPVAQRFYYPAVKPAKLAPKSPPVTIRVGRITSAPYLRDRMILRLSDVEVAFDEQDRWAAPPELLTERCIYRVLSRESGFIISAMPGAPILDIYILQFEGVADEKKVQVAIGATVQCRATGEVHVTRIDAAASIPDESPSAIARGIGEALGHAVVDLAHWVRTLPLEETEPRK